MSFKHIYYLSTNDGVSNGTSLQSLKRNRRYQDAFLNCTTFRELTKYWTILCFSMTDERAGVDLNFCHTSPDNKVISEKV